MLVYIIIVKIAFEALAIKSLFKCIQDEWKKKGVDIL